MRGIKARLRAAAQRPTVGRAVQPLMIVGLFRWIK